MSNNIESIAFPFSAVQGQKQFKLALLLATVNPLIGGVLISGPRGCAKSTLARAVADLLPATEQTTSQFVTLPLGASEDMLIGTLDLDHILKGKQVRFSPGLLQKAHAGVLYVDEVNLLPDHLVDQILDVASSGVNIVERDGVSHQHDARFALIGTMNPDEGELRPQLKDRFGLMVELDNQYNIEERINIIKTRQAFELDKVAFCDEYQASQISLQQQISDAQALLPKVTCDDACLIEIATRCQQANVDGLRADIIMHRASLTHAAWYGRSSVTLQDIEQVTPLVLAHRSQPSGTPPNSPTSSKEQNNNPANQNRSGGFSRPKPPQENDAELQTPEDEIDQKNQPNDSQEQAELDGEWGAMPPQSGEKQKTVSQSIQLPELQHTSLTKVINNKALQGELQKNAQGKTAKGLKQSSLDSHKPDWFNTLSKSLGQWPPAQFSFKKAKTGQAKHHLILLDTSASTLTEGLSSLAKSVVMNVVDSAYLQRERISLLGFGNNQVETIIKASKAPKKVQTLLDGVNAVGGTPLRQVLEKARQSVKQFKIQTPDIALFCYLITDGRSRADIHDLKLQIPTLLVDIEKATIKRGRGVTLAAQLDAQYFALSS